MNLIVSWIALSFAVWLTATLMPSLRVRRLSDAIIVAAIFGTLNWAIGWLLFVLIGIGTLGLGFLLAFLARWLATAIVLKLTDVVTQRITIANFTTAIWAALLMSGIGTLVERLLMWLVGMRIFG
jgi:putative membrane protein